MFGNDDTAVGEAHACPFAETQNLLEYARSKLDRKGLVTGFQKLASVSGGASGSSMLSSHPPSSARAAAMQKRLDGTV